MVKDAKYIIRWGNRAYVIPDFPDYCITKEGKIWSNYTNKFLRLHIKKRGYLSIDLCREKIIYCKQIHRLVLETFIGPCPDGMEACHDNGNPADNRLENLRWDTHSNNLKDTVKHGTHVDNRGEKCGTAKLNTLQVRIIKHLLSFESLLQQEIANIFGVSSPTISEIKHGRKWKHVLI